MIKKNDRVFFKGLNELRALAALSIIFFHIEHYKHGENIKSLFDTRIGVFISNLGMNGVYLFFVLSGFLITYLLLQEKTDKGFINIRSFYFRRILRIWPVYYLVMVIAFFILPPLFNYIPALAAESSMYLRIKALEDNFGPPFLLFLFFLPNLSFILKPYIAGASQAWSVGVEEQFYLLWPNVINKVKTKLLPYVFISIIIFLTLIKKTYIGNSHYLIKVTRDFLAFFVIELMAIGALSAYYLFYFKELVQRIFTNQYLYIINILIILIFLFKNVNLVVEGCFFAMFILFTVQDSSKLKLQVRSRFLSKIGTYSYGIYMYHPIIMIFIFSLIDKLNYFTKASIGYNCFLYITICSLSLIIGYVSYYKYEVIFLRLKDKKFTLVKSGNEI